MKSALLRLPEYYLLLLAILTGFPLPFQIHPFFIGIIVILIIQIIFKNRITGLVLGILFFLSNLYFLGALLSELNEFTVFNYSAKQLLVVGLSIWLINIVAAIIMIYKYLMVSNQRKAKLTYQ
jgi:small-conductance mechanosensitive channel